MEFGVKSTLTETINADGKKVVSGVFNTNFFDKTGAKLPNCNSDNMQNLVPKMSSVTVVAQWQSIALGEFGASLKPKAEQIMVFPSERLSGACLLGGCDEDDDEGSGLLSENMMSDLSMTKVTATPSNKPPPLRTASKPAPVVAQPVAEEVEEVEEVEYTEENPEDGIQYINTPAPVAAKPVIKRVLPAKKA
jgi:hypothetical protein